MKAFNGYDEAKKAAESKATEKLPKGAYVCKVIEVRKESGDYGERLVLAFDIDEGDFKGFFDKQFKANTDENKKWKGRVGIFCPKDDNSEKDAITKKSFAGWTVAFEKSNPGYTWDWNEAKWKGKLVGIVFGETGTVIEGKEVVYTEARFPIEIERVRNGNAPEAKFKAKNGYTGKGVNASADAKPDDAFMTFDANDKTELPF